MNRRAWCVGLALCLLWTGCEEEVNGGPVDGNAANQTESTGTGGGGLNPASDCTELVFKNLEGSTHPPAGVRVVFSVSTCDDQPVSGLLTEGNFEILNDETGQPFGSEGDAAPTLGESTDFSFYTVVLIDLSYSVVNNGTLQDELDGAQKLIDRLVSEPSDSRKKHNVALYVFGSTAASELWQPFTKDATLLTQRLDALRADPGRGSTNLYGAYTAGLNLVGTIGIGSDARVLRAMVLMTDGTHETGDADELRLTALDQRDSMNVDIYTIGLKGDYDSASLSELASSPTNFVLAEDSEAVITAFDGIAQSVEAWAKSNYVIGVCSPLEGPGRGLTFTASMGGYSGGFTVNYDATGFNLVNCDPALIADPCQLAECGEVEGVTCAPCPGGNLCVGNVCQDYLCIPNVNHCYEGDIYGCSADGEARSLLVSCGAGEYCLESNNSASCAAQVCAPGVSFCQGAEVWQCNAEGSASDAIQDCAAIGQTCMDASCIATNCTPNTAYCDGQSVVACDATGLSTQTVETCFAGTICVESGDTAECQSESCTPDCNQKTCGDDGCGGICGTCIPGQSCVDGMCVTGGACLNGPDMAALNSVGSSVGPTVWSLTDNCLEEINVATCVTNNVSVTMGLSNSCADCYGDLGLCMMASCATFCANGWNDTCRTCVTGNCQSALNACTGLTTSL